MVMVDRGQEINEEGWEMTWNKVGHKPGMLQNMVGALTPRPPGCLILNWCFSICWKGIKPFMDIFVETASMLQAFERVFPMAAAD